MAVTHRFRVFPLYHQVEIRDATDDVDRPLWETGEERVLAAAQCIVLATRSDLDGEVEIEVRVGADLEDQAGGQLLFDGELLTTGQGILVGNSLTELHHVGLPIGWHPIRVYAEPPNNPVRFTVLVEVRSAGGEPARRPVVEPADERARPRRRSEAWQAHGLTVIPQESSALVDPTGRAQDHLRNRNLFVVTSLRYCRQQDPGPRASDPLV